MPLVPKPVPEKMCRAGDHQTPGLLKKSKLAVSLVLRIFAVMFRNSVRSVGLFNIPPENFVEVCRQIEV